MVNIRNIRVPHPSQFYRDGWDASTPSTDFVPRAADSGFTLLELMVVMAIIATLAAMAIPAFTRNVVAAKEAVLREDLQVMRTAIGSYTVDKQKAPQIAAGPGRRPATSRPSPKTPSRDAPTPGSPASPTHSAPSTRPTPAASTTYTPARS